MQSSKTGMITTQEQNICCNPALIPLFGPCAHFWKPVGPSLMSMFWFFFSMCLAWMFYPWAGNPVRFLCLNAHLRLWIFRYVDCFCALLLPHLNDLPHTPCWPFTQLPTYLALLPCILSICFLYLYPPLLQSALLYFKFPKLLVESVCRPPLKQSTLIASRKPLY